MKQIKHILIGLIALLIYSCGGSVVPSNPLTDFKRDFNTKESYTILLSDMDLQNEIYKHKFTIIDFDKSKNVTTSQTDWIKVSDDFFFLHEADLGMEILSKLPNHTLNNLVTPPGFTNIIGHDEFGKWNELSVWEFNDKALEKTLGLDGLDVQEDEYKRYQTRYAFNRPYYGEKTHGDSTKYGTRSHHWFIMRPLFYHRRISNRNFRKPRGFFNRGGSRGGGGFGK